jgi:transposase InsO family protein
MADHLGYEAGDGRGSGNNRNGSSPKTITTTAGPVDRDFVAPAPNRCWVADSTHVATFAGVVYVAFVVDTFSRRIVGWSAATSKETQLVLDALEMALWQRDRDQHESFRVR